jgi:hypothetical protein
MLGIPILGIGSTGDDFDEDLTGSRLRDSDTLQMDVYFSVFHRHLCFFHSGSGCSVEVCCRYEINWLNVDFELLLVGIFLLYTGIEGRFDLNCSVSSGSSEGPGNRECCGHKLMAGDLSEKGNVTRQDVLRSATWRWIYPS